MLTVAEMETEKPESPTAATPASGLTAEQCADILKTVVEPERVLHRAIDRIAYASDASFYRLIPQAVVLSRGVEEILNLFRFSHQYSVPLTFRAAGTSLSGQAISDGVLVELGRHWRDAAVEDAGRKVRVQPGVIGNRVNQLLQCYGVKMGPDPASINACMMGGILANNSSGMCCGVSQNAYHTLDSLTFVLPSGTVINSAAPNADELFRVKEPALARGLTDLRAEILANPALYARIRTKYKTKNTTGYSLNAFIDFERPVDIFTHLLIGSEGTLAFISEAVLQTVPDLQVKYTGLLLFHDLYAACAAIVPLRDAGAKALELMDRASLRSVEDQPGIPPSIKTLPEGAAGLLVEFQAASERERAALEAQAEAAVAGLDLYAPARFTHQADEQALLWRIRAGMFPSVGSVRKSGTTVIIEDVAFPIERLADATLDLTRLFVKHGYPNAIIFGHAKDGNLHFVITQSFNHQAAIDQYAGLMDDVVHLVVDRYDGALKAEHGTGRNVAPFVEAEWGPDAYRIMKRVKRLADPHNLLNPGVIINPAPRAHLENLKPMPTVEEEVDKCIECGYCESKCPSRDFTLTPRQRIVVRREIARLATANGNGQAEAAALKKDFPYMAVDTCAADGLCATACPVGIDTGKLIKRFRSMGHSAADQNRATWIAKRFGLIEPVVRVALRMGHLAQAWFGRAAMAGLTRTVRGVTRQPLPLWTGDLPRAASGTLPYTSSEGAQAVYFPSCISRVMGHLGGEPSSQSLMETTLTLCRRAGVPVFLPKDVAGTCCGVPFSSKGFDQAHDLAVNRAIERFWRWSGEGVLPVVIDTSPCTYGLLGCRASLTPENQQKFDRLTILDSVAFAHDHLLPRLKVKHKARAVALHPVCSLVKMNLTPKLEGVARACSEKTVVPLSAGCCGFAGDRGFLFPELTASATKPEAMDVLAAACDAHYSSSRTCELGMSRATGRIYRSFLYLLEEATRIA